MKRVSVVCVGMLIGCLVVLLPQISHAAPKIEFADGIEFDFGKVEAEETLSHTFVFKNAGDSVLNIEQVKGG